MSKIIFFRHAQASYLADDYDQLSPKGVEQSAALGNYLVKEQIHFDKIFVGPLRRQQQTYDVVAKQFREDDQTIVGGTCLGELKEHQGPEAVRKAYPQLLAEVPKVSKWYREMTENPALKKRNTLLIFQYFMEEWVMGRYVLDDIEPWSTFRSEVKKGLKTILDSTDKGETIGVFTSGGTISCMVAEALQLQNEQQIAALNFSVRNTSFTTFLSSNSTFNLLSFNELPHLKKAMITFV